MTNTSNDPYTEPGNSTVDDWHGQDIERDVAAAERAAAEADGDEAAAEIFEARRPAHRGDRFDVDAAERSGTLTDQIGES